MQELFFWSISTIIHAKRYFTISFIWNLQHTQHNWSSLASKYFAVIVDVSIHYSLDVGKYVDYGNHLPISLIILRGVEEGDM